MGARAEGEPKKAHVPRYGEGSFKWVASRRLWVGRWDTGDVTDRGTRIFVTASARDEDTAWQRFVAAKKKYALEGKPLEGVRRGQTVKGWSEVWLPLHEKEVRSGPFMTDRGNVKNWILPQIGKIKLEDLTAAHMRKVGDAPRRAGKSASTANSAQRTLHKMLVAARADGYSVPERIFAAKKVGVGKSDRTSMSKDEVSQVFTKAYELYPDAVRLFLAVLYGARKSEILGLTWDRVHLDEDPADDEVVVGSIDLSWQVQSLRRKADGTFHVKDGEEVHRIVGAWHFTKPKTQAGDRVLPVIAPVAKELREWRKKCPKGDLNPHNLVFPRIRGAREYLGYPRNKQTDLDEWKAAQKAAGVYKRPPDPKKEGDEGEFYLLHEARHSMISMLADADTPKHIIELLVGQTELVDTYVHGSLEMAGQAVSDVLAPLLPAAAR
jgi:integrase